MSKELVRCINWGVLPVNLIAGESGKFRDS
jgi:hypothetical protein